MRAASRSAASASGTPGTLVKLGTEFGFRAGASGAHMARTMMLADLTALLAAVKNKDAKRDAGILTVVFVFSASKGPSAQICEICGSAFMNLGELFTTNPKTLELLNNGVAVVKDAVTPEELKTLRFELKTYVCEGEYSKGLEKILRTYIGSLDRPEQPADRTQGRLRHAAPGHDPLRRGLRKLD